ncbi:MAG: efflux RND transporter periplasmic adaptor subunit [Lachnospiraceae bacterium]|nr:efflux RND transporter periplasmic adaptor subunit [Lachnospiraceae bacterium]
MFFRSRQRMAAAATETAVQTATVSRMDISSELSASSSLSPKDTYEVTSLVEGEVLEALFEEGDVVEKDQVLYVIDASSMDSDLSSAETSLLRAQENVQTAQEEYNEAVSALSGNTYKSTTTGYIKKLYVTEGDKVNNGTKIADIYDDSVMKITVPFLSAEAAMIGVGNEAIITLEDTGEQLPGTVTVVSSLEEVLTGGRLVKAVTIETSNPGGLTTLTQATVTVGDFVCSNEGTFTPKTEAVMTADLSGNNGLEVGSLLIAEGSYVTAGTPVFAATSKSAEKYMDGFADSLESAKDNLENAENKLTNTQDNIDNYTITAPISGTVITKNAKVGDNITKSSGSSSSLCVIYDLSAMTLQMSVDELDVRNVKAGQDVTITADAIEGEVFSGTVTNVSLQGSYSQGVTNYPVTITMTETGELLPGMNVDAEIILEKSENALCIPVGALMRVNRVYVKEDSETGKAALAAISGETENADGAEESGETSERGARPEGAGQNRGGDENAEADASGAAGERPEGGFGGERPEKGQGSKTASMATISQNGVPEGFVAVQVETGVINDDYVEILSGLVEGDVVYIDPSAGSTMTNMFQMGMPGGMNSMPGGGMPGGGNMGGNRGGGGMGGRP